jgi:hypothetical protein
MAYMNPQKKSIIATELKKVVPAGWKYSLRVDNHMTLVMTVSQAPVDLEAAVDWYEGKPRPDYTVNPYHFRNHILNEKFKGEVAAIIDALNTCNHDNSDVMSDYFDVGHYIDLRFGAWNKPFVSTAVRQFT